MTIASVNSARFLRIAVAAVLAAGSTGALGQDKESGLEAVVVSAPRYVPNDNRAATKLDIPLVETPQAVSVITRDQIDLLSWQNIEQTVRYTSGVVGENFGADERYDWFTLRGFSPVQYIDGLISPVGSTSTTGIDLFGFESIEILKGPSSVLYGQNPPGGLVNLTSRRPQEEFGGEASLQYGTHDHKQGTIDVTGPVDDEGRFLYRVSALVRDRNTQVDFIDAKRVFVAPSFKFQFTPETSLTLLSYYQDDDAASTAIFLPAEGTRLPNPNGRIPVSRFISDPDFEDFDREQYGIGYEFDHEFNEIWSLHQGFKYASVDSEQDTLFGAGLQADLRTLNLFYFIFNEDIESLAVDTRAQAKFTTGSVDHTFLIGIDDRRIDNTTGVGFSGATPIDVFTPDYSQDFGPPPGLFTFKTESDQDGLYVQDHMKIDRFLMTLSLRNDWTDSGTQKDEEMSYRAGVNYLFDSGVAPYIAYARSFQPTLGIDFNGNEFDPTTGNQIEVGVKWDARNLPEGKKAFVTLAAYDLTQKDVLTPDPDPLHPGFSVQTGEVEVKGIEIEAVGRFNERLSFNASYSYTDSEVTESNDPAVLGNELVRVPQDKASLYVDYTWQTGPLAGLGMGAGVRYVGETFGDSLNTEIIKNESTTLWDATMHYDFSNWRLALNANNVTDKRFVSNCGSMSSCFWGPERTVYFAVSRKL